jgi:hypothetical protein
MRTYRQTEIGGREVKRMKWRGLCEGTERERERYSNDGKGEIDES